MDQTTEPPVKNESAVPTGTAEEAVVRHGTHAKPGEAAPVVSRTNEESADSTSTAVADGVERPVEPASFLWLRRGDQLIVGVLVCVVLGLTIVHWARLSGWGLRPIEIERLPQRRFDYKLDVNSATWVEWMQLEEIGEALARRIVADREQNGPFGSIDDVGRVKGIGPKTLETIRPWLTVSAEK